MTARVPAHSDTLTIEWSNVVHLATVLGRAVLRDGPPDCLVGVARGGLIPAVLLSHMLNVRDLHVIEAMTTTSDFPGAAKEAPQVEFCSAAAVKGRDVLIVDDIVGTGRTLNAIKQLIRRAEPGRVRYLTCYANLRNWKGANVTALHDNVDYIGEDVDRWVVFPWERRYS